jgi:hypothetical protein
MNQASDGGILKGMRLLAILFLLFIPLTGYAAGGDDEGIQGD